MVTARRRVGQSLPGWAAAAILPLLVAAYPVIFLFTLNAAEQLTMEPLWLPLGLAVGGAALLFALLAALLRDPHRAALLTTVAVVSFLGYGHAWNAAANVVGSQWPLIGAWILLTAVAAAGAWRAGPRSGAIVRGLTVVALIALLMNGWNLGQAMRALAVTEPIVPIDDSSIELRPPDAEPLPDVYYIVPDRYAGATGLRQSFAFDNEPFFAALEARGFAVARHAHANYVKTPLSLGSSLNMRHLDADAMDVRARDGSDREPAHRLLREPLAVPRSLKELGYRYLHIGNWWTPSSTNVDADRTFGYEGQDEFATALAQTTILRAFTDPDAAPDDPWDWRVLRGHTEYALERLDEMPRVPGPKYVFGHLLIPHDPYVFDADGSFMDRGQVRALGQRESYRRQLTYTNERLLELVDGIIAATPDAVIVLQSDEGPFPPRYQAGEQRFDWRDATDAELEEKFGILLAMRVPGADLEAAGFHDAMTPVNTFRVVFNARFGTDLPMLPDRTWTHVGTWRFYDFIEITDRLQREER